MAKGRLINKRIWKSESLMNLSPIQLLLWIGLITTADDQGRGRAHPGIVRSEVFPTRDIGWDDIDSALQLFAEMGMLIIYTGNGTSLYQVVNWWDEKYQGGMFWARPSEHPAPDGWTDRVRYRQGNAVVKENWDDSGNPAEPDGDDDEPTTSPPRAHGEPSLGSAPNPNPNDNDNDNTNDNPEPPSGASAPTTYNDWLLLLKDAANAKESVAVLVRMACMLYPERLTTDDQGIYGRVGKMARDAGSTSRLASLLWSNASRPLADPLGYITKAIHGENKGNGRGKHGAAEPPPQKFVTAGGEE